MRRYFKFLLSNLELNCENIRNSLTDKFVSYQFDANDMPILSIVFEVAVPHKLIILENGHPVLIVLHLFTGVCTSALWNELLDGNSMRVEILEREIREECDFVILVESDFNIGGAWFSLFGVCLV